MANRPPKTRNGPNRSIKAVSRGMGIGMSMLPNQSISSLPIQPIQTTAIPQTPAVCTAAVKWKNKIQPPDEAPIIEQDENAQEQQQQQQHQQQQQQQPVENNSKQPPDLATKPPPPPAAVKNRKGKNAKISKVKAPITAVSQTDDATRTDSPPEPPSESPRMTPSTDRNSTARASLVSADIEKTPLHEPQQTRQLIQNEEKDEDGDNKQEVMRADNQLIAAIPVMPLSLAVLCMFLNIVAPGTGTIIASFSLLCCNKRPEPASGKKEDAVDLMITNFCVGVSQLFTVTFLFIGLIWSITWGVFMVQFAWVRYKKDKEERERHAAISVANAFLRPGFPR